MGAWYPAREAGCVKKFFIAGGPINVGRKAEIGPSHLLERGAARQDTSHLRQIARAPGYNVGYLEQELVLNPVNAMPEAVEKGVQQFPAG